jgi:cholesterol oxidase
VSEPATRETDVVVIGSGFGGAVAALRFAEAGEKVVVLERGDRVRRETFQADLDALWLPQRASYGFHDLRFVGDTVIPWVGAAVGGGSHVYAGTLKRRADFEGFPRPIRDDDMARHFQAAEDIIGVTPYPSYPPYGDVRAYQLMYQAGGLLLKEHPEQVEQVGPVPLGITFAPEHGPGKPGEAFTNRHGVVQRYHDVREQSLLGGDIGSKNSLDLNYLALAEKRGAVIDPLCQADKLERGADGRWTVEYRRHLPSTGWQRFRRRWLPRRPGPRMSEPERIVARRVVIACGAVGSTELLLRNRDVHRTLPSLSPTLGTRYTTNGDHISVIIAFRFMIPVWLAFVALAVCLLLRQWNGAALAAAVYYAGLLASGKPYDPDLGTINSDSIRFRGPNGEPQYAYIESGRYPTPGRTLGAIAISALTGRFRPSLYRWLVRVSNLVRVLIPPFGALARTYPIPLLQMGRDRAFGTFALDEKGKLTLRYDLAANRDFYAYLDTLGRKVARAVKAYWVPNVPYLIWKQIEVPHNQGGVPMGDDAQSGVVDHAGRVFGEENLMVIDGSILPVSVGPNPALTIAAVAEHAMAVILRENKA